MLEYHTPTFVPSNEIIITGGTIIIFQQSVIDYLGSKTVLFFQIILARSLYSSSSLFPKAPATDPIIKIPKAGWVTRSKFILNAICTASFPKTAEQKIPAKNQTNNAMTTKKSTVTRVDMASNIFSFMEDSFSRSFWSITPLLVLLEVEERIRRASARSCSRESSLVLPPTGVGVLNSSSFSSS
mmetsp:Transcript_7239/g.15761  ORF Transcript_7239/g.15761 Transcript_7239/m.15761 type:complete len:184 (+) Transcript_7239:106-657(+)